jgi:hypothetical protein
MSEPAKRGRGRPRLPDDERKAAQTYVRMTHADKARLEALARLWKCSENEAVSRAVRICADAAAIQVELPAEPSDETAG